MNVAPEHLVQMLEFLIVRWDFKGEHDSLPWVDTNACSVWSLHECAVAVDLERAVIKHRGDERMSHSILVFQANVGSYARDEQDVSSTFSLRDVKRLILHNHFSVDLLLVRGSLRRFGRYEGRYHENRDHGHTASDVSHRSPPS